MVRAASPINGRSRERKPTGLPKIAPARSQGIRTKEPLARNKPAGFARNERSIPP